MNWAVEIGSDEQAPWRTLAGQASGSELGVGGLKPSLPDHYFQSLTVNFWCAALSGLGEIEAAKASKINNLLILYPNCYEIVANHHAVELHY
jgi:hypothetical protein